jgi:hypothetical protein
MPPPLIDDRLPHPRTPCRSEIHDRYRLDRLEWPGIHSARRTIPASPIAGRSSGRRRRVTVEPRRRGPQICPTPSDPVPIGRGQGPPRSCAPRRWTGEHCHPRQRPLRQSARRRSRTRGAAPSATCWAGAPNGRLWSSLLLVPADASGAEQVLAPHEGCIRRQRPELYRSSAAVTAAQLGGAGARNAVSPRDAVSPLIPPL